MSLGTKDQSFVIRRQVRMCVASLFAIVYCPAHAYPAAATGCIAALIHIDRILVFRRLRRIRHLGVSLGIQG